MTCLSYSEISLSISKFPAAQDYDTPPDKLTFIITHLTGGRIESNLHPNATITSFTQSNINNGEIFFVHDSNHLNGQINFAITDGDHTNAEQVLHITTNPVSLEIVKNENLHVFPLTRKQILPEQLQFRYELTVDKLQYA